MNGFFDPNAPQQTNAFDYGYEQRKIERQRQLAEKLLARGEAPQGQMVSGHYVAPNLLQYLAAGLNQYNAYKMNQQADESDSTLGSRADQATLDVINQIRQQNAPVERPVQFQAPAGPTDPRMMGENVGTMGETPTEMVRSPNYIDPLSVAGRIARTGPTGQLYAQQLIQRATAKPDIKSFDPTHNIVKVNPDGTTSVIQQGSAKPTTAQEKLAMLLSAGVPKPIAEGIVGGRYQPTPEGVVDVATGQFIGLGGQQTQGPAVPLAQPTPGVGVAPPAAPRTPAEAKEQREARGREAEQSNRLATVDYKAATEEMPKIEAGLTVVNRTLDSLNEMEKLAPDIWTGTGFKWVGNILSYVNAAGNEQRFDAFSAYQQLMASVELLKGQGAITEAERAAAAKTTISRDMSKEVILKHIQTLRDIALNGKARLEGQKRRFGETIASKGQKSGFGPAQRVSESEIQQLVKRQNEKGNPITVEQLKRQLWASGEYEVE